MAVHRILSTTDKAVAAYLISEGVGTDANILPAKRASENAALPYVVCMAPSAKPTQQYSGNWTVQVEIEVHTNAAPDKDENEETMVEDSDDLASDVFDAFLRYEIGAQSGDSLADAITAAARGSGLTYTALSASVLDVEQGRTEKLGEWVDKITIELSCVPSNI